MEYVARRPLFDRLLDENADILEDNGSPSLITKEELKESIGKELSSLLNTRCVLPQKLQKEVLPLSYGLPYLFGLQEEEDMTNPILQRKWAQKLEQIIAYFEPRLSNPKVKIQSFGHRKQNLEITIEGYLLTHKVREKVTFPLHIEINY